MEACNYNLDERLSNRTTSEVDASKQHTSFQLEAKKAQRQLNVKKDMNVAEHKDREREKVREIKPSRKMIERDIFRILR